MGFLPSPHLPQSSQAPRLVAHPGDPELPAALAVDAAGDVGLRALRELAPRGASGTGGTEQLSVAVAAAWAKPGAAREGPVQTGPQFPGAGHGGVKKLGLTCPRSANPQW